MAQLSVSLPSSPVTGRDDDTFQPEAQPLPPAEPQDERGTSSRPAPGSTAPPEVSAITGSPTGAGMGLGLLRMLSLGRAGHSKVNPVEEEASACRPSDDEGSREEGRLVIKHNERKSIQVARCPAPVELAIRCRIVRKGTMRPQYSCYLDDGTDKFLYTARRSLTAIRSWYTFFEDNSAGSHESGSLAQLRANLAGSEYMLFADTGPGDVQPGSPRSPRSRLKLESAAKCIIRFGKSFASVGEPGSRSLTVVLPGVSMPDGAPPAAAAESPSPPYARCASSPPLRGPAGDLPPAGLPALRLGGLPADTDGVQSAGLVLETKAPVWSPTKKAYNLDFPKGRVKVASSKNFLLVPARAALPQGPGAPVLLCGRTGKNSFALDFSPPLSALQAFAVAIAQLDNKLCYAI